MRRLLVLLAFVLLVLPAQAGAGTVFLIDGRGWGHGVGMSQYGARGYAEAGWGYQRILKHYYRGTKLQARPRQAGARPARRGQGGREDRLFEAVQGRRRTRQGAKAEARDAERRRREARAAPLAAPLRPRRGAAPPRRRRVPRHAARPQARRQARRSSTGSRSTATCAGSSRGRCRTTGIPRRCAPRPSSRAPMRSRR